jgi:hypothetical protein
VSPDESAEPTTGAQPHPKVDEVSPAAEHVEVLDLTTTEPVPRMGVESPDERPTDVVRENTRGKIALRLLYLIGLVILGTFASVALNWTVTSAELKDLLTAVLNPLVGLFGAVIGFYFGSMDRDSKVGSPPDATKRGGLLRRRP